MRLRFAAAVLLSASLVPALARAQGADSVGTRAQGMAGAFVAVTDDASAVYWNPAALGKGAYFSLVMDGNRAETVPDSLPALSGGKRSGYLLALGTPALGLSYYRLENKIVNRPITVSRSAFQLDTLTTQHIGATFVQSLTDFLTVCSTVKIVRGVAGTGLIEGERDEILDHADVPGRSTGKFDLDAGVLLSGPVGRIGLVVRNISEPGFEVERGGRELVLDRQIRGGASVLLLESWKLAADFDFTKQAGPFGEVREIAIGSEGQVTRRLAARAGIRFNTAGDDHAPGLSVGGSFAALGSLLVDAQITGGSDKAFTGWGIAGRVVF